MKNVSRVLLGFFIIVFALFFLLVACNNKIKNDIKESNIIMLDVWKSPTLDTLTFQLNPEDGTTTISIIENNKPIEIISVLPLFNKDFKLVEPKIESVELQANGIQSEDKGLRVLIRNTDLEPDCYFLDLQYQLYKNQWIILFLGVMNTAPSTDSIYIKRVAINQTVKEFCGNNTSCNLTSKVAELRILKKSF